MVLDYTIYLVTSRELICQGGLESAVEQAVLGGCTMVQLREGGIPDREYYRLAVSIKQVTDRYAVPLIINDRADIAMAAGAAGVHIGQRDLPPRAVREMLSPGMLLGVSVQDAKQAGRAASDGADYLGVGAMFPTATKTDAGIVSLEELRAIRREVGIPIVVIGGVNCQNAAAFGREGVDGLAVVSAILAQPDIKKAAGKLKAAFLQGVRQRVQGEK